MSGSNCLYRPIDSYAENPPPTAYSINPDSSEDDIRTAIGVTQWRLRAAKEKLKTVQKLHGFSAADVECERNYKALLARLDALKAMLAKVQESKLNHSRKFAPPRKSAFSSSAKREFQKSLPVQEAPTFYMSEAQWDFGSSTRYHIYQEASLSL